jgi:hypothetical protein
VLAGDAESAVVAKPRGTTCDEDGSSKGHCDEPILDNAKTVDEGGTQFETLNTIEGSTLLKDFLKVAD